MQVVELPHRGVALRYLCRAHNAPSAPPTSSAPAVERYDIVYAHGLTENLTCADKYVDWTALLDEDESGSDSCVSRLLTYDARGHGESSTPPDPTSFVWHELALDMWALTDTVWPTSTGDQPGGIVACGASMGCATALNAALQQPARVYKLVLIIPSAAWELRPPRAKGYIATADSIVDNGPGFLHEAAKRCRPPDPFGEDEQQTEAFRADRLQTLEACAAESLETVFRGAALCEFPTRDEMTTIIAPTLILAWTGDRSHPVEVAHEMSQLMPNATLNVASTRTEFEAWTSLTRKFLSSESSL